MSNQKDLDPLIVFRNEIVKKKLNELHLPPYGEIRIVLNFNQYDIHHTGKDRGHVELENNNKQPIKQ